MLWDPGSTGPLQTLILPNRYVLMRLSLWVTLHFVACLRMKSGKGMAELPFHWQCILKECTDMNTLKT